jgi:hypothetical protein
MDSKLKESLSFLDDIKEAGSDKINEMVALIQEMTPQIDVAGFHLNEIEVGVGLPPGINLAFTKEKDVAPETINQLLKENEDRPLFTLIVQTLQKADTLVKGMKLTNFKLGEMAMKIGLPPDVNIKLLRLENPA